jgi:hypothetical protein
MLQVESDHTNELEVCTIHFGIVGVDGVRRGAIADIDLYAMFGWVDGAGREVDIIAEHLQAKRRLSKKRKRRQLDPPTDEEINMMQRQFEAGLPVGRFGDSE